MAEGKSEPGAAGQGQLCGAGDTLSPSLSGSPLSLGFIVSVCARQGCHTAAVSPAWSSGLVTKECVWVRERVDSGNAQLPHVSRYHIKIG